MNKEILRRYRTQAQRELDSSLDFWLEHGMDREFGGVMTCLDREGHAFSGDKSVWMQGRCGWIYANMCNLFGRREQWLEFSKSCVDFMDAHCFNPDAQDRMFFVTTRDGQALRQRRYHYSEGFYTMACAEYAAAASDGKAIERARRMYETIWALDHGSPDPVGIGPKQIPGIRPGRALAQPMNYLGISAVMRRCDPIHKELYDSRAHQCASEIVTYHVKPELGCTLEFVQPDGGVYHDFCSGRQIAIGHDFECSWYLLDEANRQNAPELREKAIQVFDMAVAKGWDKEYGGLLYLVDCDGWPCESYEHDMKLWWPHCEMILSSIMLYRDTGDEKYLGWFEKAWEYSMSHFSDKAYGEWYGYLRRDGLPTEPAAKGTLFKGPFHVPRTMSMVVRILTQMIDTPDERKMIGGEP